MTAFKRIEMTTEELKTEIMFAITSYTPPLTEKADGKRLPDVKYILEKLNRGGKLEVCSSDLVMPINKLILENKLAVQVMTTCNDGTMLVSGFVIPTKN